MKEIFENSEKWPTTIAEVKSVDNINTYFIKHLQRPKCLAGQGGVIKRMKTEKGPNINIVFNIV